MKFSSKIAIDKVKLLFILFLGNLIQLFMWKKLILPFICNKTWIKEAEIVGNFLSHCFYCKNIAADFIINHVVKLRIRQNNWLILNLWFPNGSSRGQKQGNVLSQKSIYFHEENESIVQ